VFDCLLGAAGRVIPDERWRGEVVDLARRSAAGEGVVGRGREVVSAGVAVAVVLARHSARRASL
jgi:hypothetical protein